VTMFIGRHPQTVKLYDIKHSAAFRLQPKG
jgi:hypothetical protein